MKIQSNNKWARSWNYSNFLLRA